ncbi:hypothetical protein L218DRAFT_878244 [Marasmius fiardii PR-910]|nr:hypothetical protein L218DRAFT_878244 [Marasmius fiardii PR-910]
MTTEEEVDFQRTILLVGDTGCGKTSLVNAFISGVFTEHYAHSKPCSDLNLNSTSGPGYQTIEPKSLEEGRHAKTGLVENGRTGIHQVFRVEEKTIDFTLRDTNGNEDEEIFDALVHEAHVVFVCFAMDDPPSLENARHKVRCLPCNVLAETVSFLLSSGQQG